MENSRTFCGHLQQHPVSLPESNSHTNPERRPEDPRQTIKVALAAPSVQAPETRVDSDGSRGSIHRNIDNHAYRVFHFRGNGIIDDYILGLVDLY